MWSLQRKFVDLVRHKRRPQSPTPTIHPSLSADTSRVQSSRSRRQFSFEHMGTYFTHPAVHVEPNPRPFRFLNIRVDCAWNLWCFAGDNFVCFQYLRRCHLVCQPLIHHTPNVDAWLYRKKPHCVYYVLNLHMQRHHKLTPRSRGGISPSVTKRYKNLGPIMSKSCGISTRKVPPNYPRRSSSRWYLSWFNSTSSSLRFSLLWSMPLLRLQLPGPRIRSCQHTVSGVSAMISISRLTIPRVRTRSVILVVVFEKTMGAQFTCRLSARVSIIHSPSVQIPASKSLALLSLSQN
jgi:hypothetical protein